MDFFVDHSGFFLAVGVIMLLALIGYYADKKDSNKGKKKNSGDKSDFKQISEKNENSNITEGSNKFINTFDYNLVDDKSNSVDSFIENSIPDGFENGTISDSSILTSSDMNISDNSGSEVLNSDVTDDKADMNLSSDVVGSLSSDINSFNVSDFENISMSLDDLEKKNYEGISNKSTAFDDSENYYYSNLDDSESVDSSLVDDLDKSSENVIENSDIQNNDISESVLENSDIQNNDISESVDLSIDSDSSNITNEVNVSESEDIDYGHEFDSEVSNSEDKSDIIDTNDSIPELFSDNSNQVISSFENSSNDDVVTDSSIVNPLSDSSSEDIWKF